MSADGEDVSVEDVPTPTAASAPPPLDPHLLAALQAHIVDTLPNIVQGNKTVLQQHVDTKETETILSLFLSDPLSFTLVVHRRVSVRSGEKSTGGGAASAVASSAESSSEESALESYSFDLQLKPPSSVEKEKVTASVAFIKTSPSLDLSSSPLSTQLLLICINESNLFESMLTYVRHCFLPYSRAWMGGVAGEDAARSESDLAVYRGVNRKLGELEVELLRFQENIDIPHIVLDVPKAIADFVRSQRAAGIAHPKVEDMGPIASDPTFLNDIQRQLNEWKKSILRVTKLTRDVSSGSTIQEVNFWLAMERAINAIYDSKESVPIEFTFNILRQNKRFLATTGFMQDVGLSEEGREKDKVHRYSSFLKDLPIKRLLSSNDLPELIRSLELLFGHLKQLRRIDYPLGRSIALVHTLARDVVSQVQSSLLNSKKIMNVPYAEFVHLTAGFDELFSVWSAKCAEFGEMVRGIGKKQPGENISKLKEPYADMDDLRLRIAEIKKIRKEHEELRTVITSTLNNDAIGKQTAMQQIHDAYAHFQDEATTLSSSSSAVGESPARVSQAGGVNVLSITPDGKEAFATATAAYLAKIDLVEAELERKIRQFLDAAKDDSNEMFRVCAKFNALFIRPRIQSAIREYQEQLIHTVKKDIDELQAKFTNKFAQSEARRMSEVLRDLPPVSSMIIWSKQIERQLSLYMVRVESVLGKQWHHHFDGRQLKRDTDDFRARLKPISLYQRWLVNQQEQVASLQVRGPIFRVVATAKHVSLAVNFDKKLVTLFKEVRNLARLEQKIPFDIITAADEAKQNYPFAMRLEEVIRIYSRTCAKIDARPSLALLAAGHKRAMQESIGKGIGLQWLDSQVKSYVDQLGTQSVEFQDQVEELVTWVDTAEKQLSRLDAVDPTAAVDLKQCLDEIQNVIDHVDKRGFSNLEEYIHQVDAQVEAILVGRCQIVITAYTQSLDREYDEAGHPRTIAASEQQKPDDDDEEEEKDNSSRSIRAILATLDTPASTHEILIRNQVLTAEPSLETSRLHLVRGLHKCISTVVDLPRLRTFTSDVTSVVGKSGAAATDDHGRVGVDDTTYRSVLAQLPTGVLQSCLSAIERKMSLASSYVDTWMQYQALWDMDMDVVVSELGSDLARWEQLLVDMKTARATFDNSATRRRFGPIVIEYASVQTKVNNKYDSWHKSILARFGQLLGDALMTLFTTLRSGRENLEKHSFDLSSTSEIVESVTLLQGLSKKAAGWSADIVQYQSLEKLLTRHRYHFPAEWLFTERVLGEWSAFEQIRQRKMSKMSEQSSAIQAKILAEDVQLEQRIKSHTEEWKKSRPVSGTLNHDVAFNSLIAHETTLNKLESDSQRLNQAKRSLDMVVRDTDATRLSATREELNGLKEIWTSLRVIWVELDELSSRLFKETKPADLRRALQRLQNEQIKFPNFMKSYESYEYLKSTLKSYLALNGHLSDLHSTMLRPKHEKLLLKEIGLASVSWADLTVGQLWAIDDFKSHTKAIKSIMDTAQGESALESFLAELKDQWEATKLDLVDYKSGKIYLIRNWDALFAQLTDRLSDLSACKQSPYFKSFEADALRWESKLNIAQAIFDVFIDVQRRWLSMSGTFEGSSDIQTQLATQFKRFKTFDRDFTRLMRDIFKDPAIDIWVREERNLLQELSTYAETLNNIQKALGEYLEKQRVAFPRFYFIGDDALLEIIGNAKMPIKIQTHLPKLFAGIAALGIDEPTNTIHSMISTEGETVPFIQTITVGEDSSVHAWLNAVQYQMRYTLAILLERAVDQMASLRVDGDHTALDAFFAWVDAFPAQIVLLATQVHWSQSVEAALDGSAAATDTLKTVLAGIESTLEFLADRILSADISGAARKKYEQLITEKVHQRDATRVLVSQSVVRADDFEWLSQSRFYFTPLARQIELEKSAGTATMHDESTEPPVLRCLTIKISRAQFHYGFEYLGVGEKLVQTPLTDRAYLTLGEALHMRLGGNPFGPAGTGKTETVKAMGAMLGRFVLVFNCDETFDFNAMGRIFVGLCQCGAWGCFDEFNRLEERILSAVSQQILTIQVGLRESRTTISLLDRPVKLDPRIGMFITMNPGYAGRSELPDNLKQLFRGMAMVAADRLLIGQVMLYSQGFRTAEDLSSKVGLLFQLCEAQLSSQSHYDFGLRALKSVLRSAGNLKRAFIARAATAAAGMHEEEKTKILAESEEEDAVVAAAPTRSPQEEEQDLLVKSICATVAPKLVAADLSLFSTLVTAVFPGAHMHTANVPQLRKAITALCATAEHSLEDSQLWVDKIMQLNEISTIHHGVILVGPSSSGKTTAWKILREALEQTEGKKISTYVIDPKAITKDELYGVLDSTTLEFTDGVFTHILRKILDNVRGEQSRQHWIIFDGDVDPVWCENLNSVLDDNKLLTLPNGERLALTPNIRIMFEVANLNFATPATVSRCGMTFFSEAVVTTPMIMLQRLRQLKAEPLQLVNLAPSVYARWKSTQVRCVELLEPLFGVLPGAAAAASPSSPLSAHESVTSCFVLHALNWVEENCDHIMTFSRAQGLVSLFSMLKGGISKVIEYNDNHADFPIADKSMEAYLGKYLVFSVLWAFGGSLSLKDRLRFSSELVNLVPPSVSLPSAGSTPLIDFEVQVDSGEWRPYDDRIEAIELESQKVVRADIVIDTIDTARHTDVINTWLIDRRPLLLCGPPGSGKSMTLTAVLRSVPEFELVTLNFSSTTTPKLLLDTLAHYCKVDRTPNGLVMHPVVQGKTLAIFLDEINLPSADQYQTVPVITFLRQIAEHGGFWRASDLAFIKLDRIQFIGACNPPTDAGRVPLSPRFLRHSPLLFVDFPAVPSLKQIYGTFNRALLKLVPSLRSHAEPLTEAMIEVYSASQARFTPDQQSHYIQSPRELSRWVRAMYEALKDGSGDTAALTVTELVRLWLHEALRLFQDKLVFAEERQWTDELINGVARKYWPNADLDAALARPVLFSNWLTKNYTSVGQSALREHVKTRLRVFYEEELDVKLVIFDEVLEHILRIDRVLRQPLGHLLLVGTSGAGKTILSKFVSWMQGMSVFQIKVHKHYSAKDFDKDLRALLTRAGCANERICFIFDESNVLNTAFLERMNSLLASGEVPGLFEGQDFTALMAECKEAARKDGVILDTEEELYRHFVGQVQRNLHVVFTMNPASDDFSNRAATSPALYNRCTCVWMGEWSSESLFQVGYEFTKGLDLGDGLIADADRDADVDAASDGAKLVVSTVREAVVSTLVFVHESVTAANKALSTAHAGAKSSHVTPRHYLDLIKHYATLFSEKRSSLEDQQRHLNTGLRKLKETSEEVMHLQSALQLKDVELREKKQLANDKLEQIMVDQREAESKRDISVQIGAEIKVQEAQIAKRREGVESELMQARPALEEAENAVRSIKKADLDTVSRFPSPPQPVKFALEAVCVMLGESANDWADLKRVIRRADFIKSVINFDVDQLSEKVRAHLLKTYISDPNFAYDVVMNASKACGPLVKWVTSTINFARIKNSVAPLENELKAVAIKQDELVRKQEELQRLRDELGARIDQYKSEYSMLIAEVERIKAETTTVQTKVDRSMALLTNLGSERGRWEADSASFQTQINTIVGDCLLSAAFLAYIGYFNQTYRQMLVESWQDRLHEMKVPTKKNINLIEYLSTPSERLDWQAKHLPVDELATENAIMIQRFNRYPLVIDPSGQAVTFLMKAYADRKILRTSFLDDAFLKHLESALRFGNALLVEDVENLDPILNSVLNREISKTGGRVMITLGDKEIDYSPSFTIFLSTRDASSRFAADLCSRVTLVNFSVTPSSLTLQCLSKVLQAERPDISRSRSDLLKLQGEFRVRLRHLEESLLNALNAVKGNILDSEEIITSLETLKQEAAEVMQKMADSETVMGEVTAVSESFRPFAAACSSIYFSLEKLADVHFLYQFSLPFFLQIVDRLLFPPSGTVVVPQLAEEKDPMRRLALLTAQLFTLSYTRVSRALLNDDHVPFGMRLAQIALADANLHGWRAIDDVELEFFMKGSTFGLGASRSTGEAAPLAGLPNELGLTRVQKVALAEMVKLPAFARFVAHITSSANLHQWQRFLHAHGGGQSEDGSEADVQVPTGWEVDASAPRHVALFHALLVSKVLRADRVPSLSAQFVSAVFGDSFLRESAQSGNDLARIVAEEGSAASPLLLVSRPGFDASAKVDALAASLGPAVQNSYVSMAMGSPEGYEQADQAINAALKKGSMLLLKNVHLSPAYLSSLEKRLHRLASSAHPSFRLFLTAELSDKLPANLLRMSNLILFEPPVGIKSSLRRSWAALTPARVNRAPAERGRLYFLLAWLHGLVLERLRYTPVAWVKPFEFSETDAACSCDAIDEWVDRVAAGRVNLAPEKVPWDAIRTSLEVVMYGGRIDNAFDQARLRAFVQAIFTPRAYETNFPLVSTFDSSTGAFKTLLAAPEATTYEGFHAWIESLEDTGSPEMIGLQASARNMLLVEQAAHTSAGLLAMQDETHETDGAIVDSSLSSTRPARSASVVAGDATTRPAWMNLMDRSIAQWASKLPTPHAYHAKNVLAVAQKSLAQGQLSTAVNATEIAALAQNPLYRCLQREFTILAAVLETVSADLGLLRDVLAGRAKPDNHVRELLAVLRKDALPKGWYRAGMPKGLAPSTWMEDLARRLMQMQRLVALKPREYAQSPIWLGGLQAPEGLVAATRQAVAHAHSWPLEQLQLKVTVADNTPNDDSFVFEGVVLHGAAWTAGSASSPGGLDIVDDEKLSTVLPQVRFTWVRRSPIERDADARDLVGVPVYLDDTRQNFLFEVRLPQPTPMKTEGNRVWTQRGTCITVWSLAGHSQE